MSLKYQVVLIAPIRNFKKKENLDYMIIELPNKNIFQNLSIEEYLMDNFDPPILILWKSSPCVVLGKNQNPWIECNLKLMKDENITLARRISGGGAVYHDEGNLNYSLIHDNRTYERSKVYEMIISALCDLDVLTEKNSKNNLLYNGKKFSGTAFAYRKNKVLHHGTLLLNSNINNLNKYLNSDKPNITTKAVKSNTVDVINLNLPTEFVIKAIKNQYEIFFNKNIIGKINFDEEKIKKYYNIRSSNDWIYGKTPKFYLIDKNEEIEISKKNYPNLKKEIFNKLINLEKMFS
tara:strand:- start:132 stop:1007 length:876 start_codon:yes stop_codon:yes gene_type:complete